MTQQNISPADRLQQIQREVAEWNASAKRRRAVGTVLMIVIVAGTAAYLAFAYSQFSQVRPTEVIQLAEDQLRPVLDVPEPELTEHFKQAAPAVIASLEEGVLELPAMVERRVYDHMNSELDTALPQLEQQLASNFRQALVVARETAVASGRNVDDPKQVEALMDEIAAVLRTEMEKVINDFYSDYASQAEDLSSYLLLLAEGQDLDERQKLQREILIHFFALIDHYQTHGTPELAPSAAAN